MIWLCPYTAGGVKLETFAALEAHAVAGDSVRLVDVGHDPYAYGRLLLEQWEMGLDFAIVEHDIVIREDVAREFHECPDNYCCFPYSWQTCVGPALGCTRFRAAFMELYPDAMRSAVDTPSAYGLPGHWRQLDVYLMRRVLRDLHGEQPHVHVPAVEHLNEAQALRPDASPQPVLMVEGFA